MFNFEKKRRSDEIRILLGTLFLIPFFVYFLIGGPFWLDLSMYWPSFFGEYIFFSYILPLFFLCAWPAGRYMKKNEKAAKNSFFGLAYLFGFVLVFQYVMKELFNNFPYLAGYLLFVVPIGATLGGLINLYFRCRRYWRTIQQQASVE